MKTIRDIELAYIYPPIPDRSCDWQATRKGWEPGEPAGHGPTPVVALAALLEAEMDAEDLKLAKLSECRCVHGQGGRCTHCDPRLAETNTR